MFSASSSPTNDSKLEDTSVDVLGGLYQVAIRKVLDQCLRISMHMFSSCISLRSGHKEKFISGIFILDYIYIRLYLN